LPQPCWVRQANYLAIERFEDSKISYADFTDYKKDYTDYVLSLKRENSILKLENW
jgi:hypothetical protein